MSVPGDKAWASVLVKVPVRFHVQEAMGANSWGEGQGLTLGENSLVWSSGDIKGGVIGAVQAISNSKAMGSH
jgi:hypothetical protein